MITGIEAEHNKHMLSDLYPLRLNTAENAGVGIITARNWHFTVLQL